MGDRPDVRRYLLTDLGKVIDLDQEAFARVAGPDAPRLDTLDGLEDLGRIGERHLHRLRDVFERHLEISEVVQVADDVFGHGVQSLREKHARVPGEVLREGLLGFRAYDRIELVLFLVALHQARTFEGLRLQIFAAFVRSFAGAEAVQADTAGERLTAQRAGLDFLEVEGGVLLQLLVDDVLQLERAELEDVVRRDLLGRDLELLLREES